MFQPCSFGNRRIDLVGIREIPFPDVADIVFNFPQVKNKKHMTGFEIAQLQNKKYLGLDRVQLLQRRHFCWGQSKVLNTFFMREPWMRIERVYLITAEDL